VSDWECACDCFHELVISAKCKDKMSHGV
jgi:hypothetical protein